MIEALALPFLQRVLLAGLLASIACGIVGSYVVAKRIASITGGLSHAAFGGIGLGYLLGFAPLGGAAAFAVACAGLLTIVYRRWREGLETLISMVWSLGMALGVIFVAFAPGYAPDLTSYLFGSLVFVPWSYIVIAAGLDIVLLVLVMALFKELEAVAFDEEFAEIAGTPVTALLLGLLCTTALTVVVLIRVAGVILAIALLTIPAAVAQHWAPTLGRMMAVATAIAAAATTAGLLLSYWLSEAFGLSAPSGPLVVVVAASIYAASGIMRYGRRRFA